MAMEFYADESEATGQVFTLAGFMAAPSGWDLFIPKWRQMLCDTGPYPIDSFHAADIEAAKHRSTGGLQKRGGSSLTMPWIFSLTRRYAPTGTQSVAHW